MVDAENRSETKSRRILCEYLNCNMNFVNQYTLAVIFVGLNKLREKTRQPCKYMYLK